MKKIELLAPAGDMEKLKTAIYFGADAVYLAGNEFGLRAYAGNFNNEELKEAVEFVHANNKKVYLAINIIADNTDIKKMPNYLKEIKDIGLDAVIVSDPGIIALVLEYIPEMEIHLSTQTSTRNYGSAIFWHKLGVKRIVLARELSVKEIKEMSEEIPDSLELEAFVHGAMCVSYSGRCLMSNYMTGRDSNKGMCAQPCRWNYSLMEEKRPGEYWPVFEDERGTYFFNSKDLCMINHLPEVIEAGVTSLKIEGRMKSPHYVATIVSAYRKALDEYLKNPDEYVFKEEWLEEVKKASHRAYSTGFFFGNNEEKQIYATGSYIRGYTFIGKVLEYDKINNIAIIEQRNHFKIGDVVEITMPSGNNFNHTVIDMKDDKGCDIIKAPHPQMKVYMPFDREVEVNSLIRRKDDNKENEDGK